MEGFIVKDVGGETTKISKNEFIMRQGYRLSIAIMNLPFIESAAILDYEGNIITTVIKE